MLLAKIARLVFASTLLVGSAGMIGSDALASNPEGQDEPVELECGISPMGTELCNWTIGFDAGQFVWRDSDVGSSGD